MVLFFLVGHSWKLVDCEELLPPHAFRNEECSIAIFEGFAKKRFRGFKAILRGVGGRREKRRFFGRFLTSFILVWIDISWSFFRIILKPESNFSDLPVSFWDANWMLLRFEKCLNTILRVLFFEGFLVFLILGMIENLKQFCVLSVGFLIITLRTEWSCWVL